MYSVGIARKGMPATKRVSRLTRRHRCQDDGKAPAHRWQNRREGVETHLLPFSLT